MQKGSGEETTALGSGGGKGGNHQGIQRLWDPPGDGDLLPKPGTGDLGGGRRLAVSDKEIFPGEGGVEEDGDNPHQGGGGSAGVRLLL